MGGDTGVAVASDAPDDPPDRQDPRNGLTTAQWSYLKCAKDFLVRRVRLVHRELAAAAHVHESTVLHWWQEERLLHGYDEALRSHRDPSDVPVDIATRPPAPGDIRGAGPGDEDPTTGPDRHQSQRRHYPTGPDAIFAEYRCLRCKPSYPPVRPPPEARRALSADVALRDIKGERGRLVVDDVLELAAKLVERQAGSRR